MQNLNLVGSATYTTPKKTYKKVDNPHQIDDRIAGIFLTSADFGGEPYWEVAEEVKQAPTPQVNKKATKGVTVKTTAPTKASEETEEVEVPEPAKAPTVIKSGIVKKPATVIKV